MSSPDTPSDESIGEAVESALSRLGVSTPAPARSRPPRAHRPRRGVVTVLARSIPTPTILPGGLTVWVRPLGGGSWAEIIEPGHYVGETMIQGKGYHGLATTDVHPDGSIVIREGRKR